MERTRMLMFESRTGSCLAVPLRQRMQSLVRFFILPN